MGADVEVAEADVVGGEEVGVLRHLGDDIAHVGEAQLLDVLGVDHRHRLGRGEGRVREAGAGDHHLLHGRALIGLVVLGPGGAGSGEPSRQSGRAGPGVEGRQPAAMRRTGRFN